MVDDPDEDPREKLRQAERRLASASTILDEWILMIDVLKDEAKKDHPPKEREFNDTVKSFNKAQMILHEETKKYARQVLANEGLLPDAPLDLDAVRAEIGGKLDRLRDTR